MTVSPEFRLAAACAMWPPSDRRTEAIRAAAAGPLDWPRFLRVARRHRVVGLVHDGLTRAQPDVPPEIAREIGAQAANAGAREPGDGRAKRCGCSACSTRPICRSCSSRAHRLPCWPSAISA